MKCDKHLPTPRSKKVCPLSWAKGFCRQSYASTSSQFAFIIYDDDTHIQIIFRVFHYQKLLNIKNIFHMRGNKNLFNHIFSCFYCLVLNCMKEEKNDDFQICRYENWEWKWNFRQRESLEWVSEREGWRAVQRERELIEYHLTYVHFHSDFHFTSFSYIFRFETLLSFWHKAREKNIFFFSISWVLELNGMKGNKRLFSWHF